MPALILACAGASTRYPGYPPKWQLWHPSGRIMGVESLEGLTGIDRLIVAVREETSVRNRKIASLFAEGDYEVEVVEVGATSDQVETVRRVLAKTGELGPFTIKDCDNSFVYVLPTTNAVATLDLQDVTSSIVPRSKSYVRDSVGAPGLITEIAEKKVISTRFCCGGYSFESGTIFLRYAGAKAQPDVTYVSHVIAKALVKHVFMSVGVSEYRDWGTAVEWDSYLRSLEMTP